MGSSTNIESNMKLTAGLLSLLQISGSFVTLSDWVKWKQEHGMEFAGNEDRVRYQHFLRTKAFVLEHNARFMRGEETYHVSLNKFAAMPNEEFVQKYMGKSYELSEKQLVTEYQCDHKYNRAAGGAPSSHSWKGSRVTGVKDQGSCGSCWTFGAGAAIEGAMCAAGNYNCNSWNGVSTQQLVDCASYNSDLNPYDNHGCNGGFQANALRYVWQNGGIDSWDSYGYQSGSSGKEYNCAYNSRNSVGTISSCGMLGHGGNEDLLVDMIYHEGVSTIAIDASGLGFQTYSGGVYSSNSCSSSRLNHAVTATGYGSQGGSKYFEVKNSWGKSWGDSGYILIARDHNNMCGVASDAQYAIL